MELDLQARAPKYVRVWRGTRATIPIALSVIPFGVAYGAVAAQSLTVGQTLLMSLTVFAGTAQFITASLLAQGASHLSILVTGILINLRLVLMSAALTPHVAAQQNLKPLAAQLLTDESFAVSIAEFERRPSDPLFFIGSGLAIYGVWQVASLIGVLFGAGIPDGFGLEYALSASLICLLFLLVRGRRGIIVALAAAVLSLILRPLVTATWSTMVATIIAATLGILVKRWR
ncbi:MAG: AzlC family ABC transporter permease [Anaerolineae bacterium]